MPVTVPVGRDPKAIAPPVCGFTLATALPVCRPPLAIALPVGRDPKVVAFPCVVVTVAKVGVTDVTTVVPATPVTPLMTGANVGVTLVTHVAAEAEDNSPTLRLPTVPTVTAATSVWFEADANSANRTAPRRGTIACFGLVICTLFRVAIHDAPDLEFATRARARGRAWLPGDGFA